MSYCRFGEADVYIYDDVRYGLFCCMCSFVPFEIGGYVSGSNHLDMLIHIGKHRDIGDYVPLDVDERIREDFIYKVT